MTPLSAFAPQGDDQSSIMHVSEGDKRMLSAPSPQDSRYSSHDGKLGSQRPLRQVLNIAFARQRGTPYDEKKTSGPLTDSTYRKAKKLARRLLYTDATNYALSLERSKYTWRDLEYKYASQLGKVRRAIERGFPVFELAAGHWAAEMLLMEVLQRDSAGNRRGNTAKVIVEPAGNDIEEHCETPVNDVEREDRRVSESDDEIRPVRSREKETGNRQNEMLEARSGRERKSLPLKNSSRGERGRPIPKSSEGAGRRLSMESSSSEFREGGPASDASVEDDDHPRGKMSQSSRKSFPNNGSKSNSNVSGPPKVGRLSTKNFLDSSTEEEDRPISSALQSRPTTKPASMPPRRTNVGGRRLLRRKPALKPKNMGRGEFVGGKGNTKRPREPLRVLPDVGSGHGAEIRRSAKRTRR